MSMALVNTIRKLGWPDRHGEIQYGNAAILCYLSSRKVYMKDLDPPKMQMGKEFVEKLLAKTA